MTTWHVISVKAENVLPVIEKIVPIMHATNHQNSAVINFIVTSSEQIVIDITKSHKDKKTIFSKCTECCKIIEHPRKKKNTGGKKNKCVVTQCPVCQENVHIRTHKCFIQPAKEEE